MKNVKYCKNCGHRLIEKALEHEGMVPYCTHCETFQFPLSNTAVSLILLSPDQKRVLLIRQYKNKDYILTAGYVNQKESLESAMRRECKEEIGREIIAYRYMKSAYYEKTNTLMCNFAAVLDCDSLQDVSDWEVDEAAWFSFEKAKEVIKQGSLAQAFLLYFLSQMEKEMVIL